MGDLWLPFDKHREERLDRGRALTREAKRVERELKKVDPHLEIVYVSDRCDFSARDFKPGYWHVRRVADDAPPSYFPIQGPDGSPRPPEMKLVEDMKAADLWRQGALQELKDRQRRNEEKAERDKELRFEQRVDESVATFKAAKRVPGVGGMTRRRWAKGLVGS